MYVLPYVWLHTAAMSAPLALAYQPFAAGSVTAPAMCCANTLTMPSDGPLPFGPVGCSWQVWFVNTHARVKSGTYANASDADAEGKYP